MPNGVEESRAAIAVLNVPSAVRRNRIRRRIRAVLTEALEGQRGVDIVVSATVAATSQPFEALRADVIEALGVVRSRIASVENDAADSEERENGEVARFASPTIPPAVHV